MSISITISTHFETKNTNKIRARCRFCMANTHNASHCQKKLRYQLAKKTHKECLAFWKEIVLHPEKPDLIEANTQWLKEARRVSLIHFYINIFCSKDRYEHDKLDLGSNPEKNICHIQKMYQYFVRTLTHKPVDYFDIWFYGELHKVIGLPDIHVSVEDVFCFDMNTTVYHSAEIPDEPIECPICMETVPTYVKTDCSHSFCGPCMSNYMHTLKKRYKRDIIDDLDNMNYYEDIVCPLCRGDIVYMESADPTLCATIREELKHFPVFYCEDTDTVFQPWAQRMIELDMEEDVVLPSRGRYFS